MRMKQEKSSKGGEESTESARRRLRHPRINLAVILFGIVFVTVIFLRWADEEGHLDLSNHVASVLRVVLLVVGSYLVASLFLRLTVNPATKAFEGLEIEQRLLLGKAYGAVIYTVATVFIFWRLGVTAQNITIFLGLATTGIAFAVRDIIMSYFAWFMLLTKKPFRIGDHIRIGDEEGRVQHIGTFYVLLDDSPERYDDFIRVPNRTFLEKPIRNFGRKEINFECRIPLGPVKDLPRGLTDRISRLQVALRKATGRPLTPFLETGREGVQIVIEFSAESYEERDQLQDKIIKTTLAVMGKGRGENVGCRP